MTTVLIITLVAAAAFGVGYAVYKFGYEAGWKAYERKAAARAYRRGRAGTIIK